MNLLMTPAEVAAEVLAGMHKAEDEAGIPRGSIALAFVDQFNALCGEAIQPVQKDKS